MSEPSVNKNNKAVSKLERIKMYDGILHSAFQRALIEGSSPVLSGFNAQKLKI